MIRITVHCVSPPNAPIDAPSVEKPPVPIVLSVCPNAWNEFIVWRIPSQCGMASARKDTRLSPT